MTYINLISSPRNISTAFMYSFAQRSDTEVLDEPFYAVYLTRSDANHPGKNVVLTSQSPREEDVLGLIFQPRSKPVVFIKNMAHHIEVLDPAFLSRVTNLFFIRNPHQIIASYAEVIEQPTLRDVGIEYQYRLFNELKEQGQQPLVLDSGLLLENPEQVLKHVCTYIGIPFESSMLQWAPGPKPYDGVWAPYWYKNVHQTTGFERQTTSGRPLPDRLKPLYEEAMRYYEKLSPFSIKP
jgi:hypothetical protein